MTANLKLTLELKPSERGLLEEARRVLTQIQSVAEEYADDFHGLDGLATVAEEAADLIANVIDTVDEFA